MTDVTAPMFEITSRGWFLFIYDAILIIILSMFKLSCFFLVKVKEIFIENVSEILNLKGQVALVVNCDTSLGRAISNGLHDMGCIVITTKNNGGTENSTQSDTTKSKNFREFKLNAENYDDVCSLTSKIEKEYGRLDILILLPTAIPKMNIFKAMESEFKDLIYSILKSYIWAIKSISPGMFNRKKGHIVAVTPFCDREEAGNTIRRAIAGIMDSFNMENQINNNCSISTTLVRKRPDDRLIQKHYTEQEEEKLIATQILQGIMRKERYVDINSTSLDLIATKHIKTGQSQLIRLQLLLISIYSFLKTVIIFIANSFTNFVLSFITYKPRKNISTQLALVTGGAMGLGREIALELAREGCNIAIADIEFETAQKTVEELKKSNVQAKAYKVDVTDAEQIKQLRLNLQKDFGTVDILVSNAGLIPMASLPKAKVKTIEKTIQVNLLAQFLLVETFLHDMITQKRGHIVATSSVAGFKGMPLAVVYTSTKHGVVGFMDSLEYELKQRNCTFIKTTTIHPWVMRTRKEFSELIDGSNVLKLIPPISPVYVGQRSVEGILKDERRVVVPEIARPALILLSMLPVSVQDYLQAVTLTFSESAFNLRVNSLLS